MALKRITDLTAAAALTGSELVAVSQSGATVKTTVSDIVATASSAVTSFNGRTGAVVPTSGDYTSDEVTEGTTNLYFTGARVAASLAAGSGISLSTVGGVTTISTTAGGGDMLKATYDPAGIAQQLVGTTAAQALTNKDLTGAGNTFPTFNQNTTGNAATATKLATARNINGVAFDGSADITIPSEQLVGINDQTGTAYTLVLADAGKDVRCTNAAAITLTVPPNSSVPFPVGTMIPFSQGGAGAVTATAGTGVTINAANGAATTVQYDARVLEKVGTDTWRVW